MTAALATIVIPTYNDFDHLRQALDDALSQTWPSIEIVVVDDCSAEPAEAHVRACTRDDPRVRVIRRPQNGGVFIALNAGAQLARGEFLYLGSANDRITPAFVERSARALIAHPEVGLCFSDPGVITGWGDDRRDFPLRLSGDVVALAPAGLSRAMRRAPFHVSSNTLLFRTKAFLGVGGYRPEMSLYADWFTTIALGFTTGIAYVPQVLSYSRCHEGAYSAPERWTTEQRCQAATTAVRILLNDYPQALGALRESRALSTFGYRCVRRLAGDASLRQAVSGSAIGVALLRDAWHLAQRVIPHSGQRLIRRLAS